MAGESGGSDAAGAAVGVAAGLATGPIGWAGLALQFISSMQSSEQSQAFGDGQANLNTSGWAVGEGSAEGADMAAGGSGLNNLPWWVWAVGTLIAVAVVKKVA